MRLSDGNILGMRTMALPNRFLFFDCDFRVCWIICAKYIAAIIRPDVVGVMIAQASMEE